MLKNLKTNKKIFYERLVGIWVGRDAALRISVLLPLVPRKRSPVPSRRGNGTEGRIAALPSCPFVQLCLTCIKQRIFVEPANYIEELKFIKSSSQDFS